MNPLWQRIAGELLASGPPDSVEQLYRYVQLYVDADAVTRSGRTPEYLAMLRPCLPLGNGITLQRPSIGAAAWFEGGPASWYATNPRRYDLAMLLAMAYARQPDILCAITDPATCDNRINALIQRIPLTESELVIAVHNFLTVADEAEEEVVSEHQKGDGNADLGWLIEQICKDYGKTPSEVIWQLTRDEVKLLTAEAADRRHREACLRAGRKVTMNPWGRQGKALRAFYALKDQIAQSTTPGNVPRVNAQPPECEGMTKGSSIPHPETTAEEEHHRDRSGQIHPAGSPVSPANKPHTGDQ